MSEQDHSLTLGALAKALAAAQGELGDAKKDAFNPHFKTRFASLSSVRATVTPVFSKHGLAITQLNEPHGDAGVCVITMLIHESGEWIRGRLFVPVVKKDPQGFGSALSYARRYSLAEIAGIASDDDDDDAEVASRAPKQEAKAPPPKANGTNFEPLIDALANAASADELAKAVLALASVKDKMTPAVRERARAAHDATIRRIDAADEAAQ